MHTNYYRDLGWCLTSENSLIQISAGLLLFRLKDFYCNTIDVVFMICNLCKLLFMWIWVNEKVNLEKVVWHITYGEQFDMLHMENNVSKVEFRCSGFHKVRNLWFNILMH